jgi:hypothetical protein
VATDGLDNLFLIKYTFSMLSHLWRRRGISSANSLYISLRIIRKRRQLSLRRRRRSFRRNRRRRGRRRRRR